MTFRIFQLTSLALLAVLSSQPQAIATEFTPSQIKSYVRVKNWSGLLEYTKAWTQAKPDDAMGWYYLGNTYGSKSHHIGLCRPTDARVAYGEAINRDSNLTPAWNALGFTNMELGNYNEAVNAFKRTVALDSRNASYWNNLGSAYAAQGNTNLASQSYRQASKLGLKSAAHNNALLHPRVVSARSAGSYGQGSRQMTPMEAMAARHYDAYIRNVNPVTGAPLPR